MIKRSIEILSILVIITGMCGCNAALQVGDRTVGVRSGNFFYTDGVLRTQYRGATFDTVWTACEQALTAMDATVIEKTKQIATGTVTGSLHDEEIVITVEYIDTENTLVGVRVGMSGNNLASRIVHNHIKEQIAALQS